ncbi:unnamed protein product [Paramecium pentaurelia]|uniref:Uncharacterized protein n=1 Tax=Paramecium pentaurelia TaxID=43138 RepID=A0A8S1VH55_9CILI|nr:unnamed protein product [Paramecium pentaurelia]
MRSLIIKNNIYEDFQKNIIKSNVEKQIKKMDRQLILE